MRTQIYDALTLLVWAQQNPNGCVAYRLIRADGGASIIYVDHPMCAMEYTRSPSGPEDIVWPVTAYAGAGEANDAGETVYHLCSECRNMLYPET